ncbi:hypothetical protein NYR72_08720 [Actinobacillus equuli subsp. haemolyticus]|uniref:hypothetical protein n=1 Tax=Actinobacillus equuli TaxID=718 RepID=UPI00241814AE|nr:hypothetical protein [Actinobacillus equuli]MDG4948590.1 hypothetical protein [Actinobacillus equuli subsp. haemolyticus]
MANITLSHITPKHFFETVKLLKMTEHRIYLTIDSLEVRFRYDRRESKDVTDKRFDQLEHFMLFLQELVNSDVPIELDEFIRTYRKSPGNYFQRRR